MLYAARFYLRFSVDEWYAMPWWQQRLYIEGLEEHRPWDTSGESRAKKGGDELPEADADLSDFARLGMQVESS